MKEGFLIGGAFIFAGLVLETSVGPVVWDAFRWPVNGIVLFAFLFVLSVYWNLWGCDSCIGVCCYTDNNHGTDTSDR